MSSEPTDPHRLVCDRCSHPIVWDRPTGRWAHLPPHEVADHDATPRTNPVTKTRRGGIE